MPRERISRTEPPFISQREIAPLAVRHTMSLRPSPSKSPSATEVHVRKIQARSLGVVALLYFNAEQTVKLAGEVLSVPGGTCGARPWPYAGPRGIVYFDAAPPPAPSPPAAAAGGTP